jgi:hypothetical protein
VSRAELQPQRGETPKARVGAQRGPGIPTSPILCSPLAPCGRGAGGEGSAQSLRPVRVPSRRCFPLAAGGDLFLPNGSPPPAGTVFDHPRGFSRTASPDGESVRTGLREPPSPQDQIEIRLSLGVLGACAVNFDSAPSGAHANRSRPIPLSPFSHKTAIRPRSVFAESEVAAADRRRWVTLSR